MKIRNEVVLEVAEFCRTHFQAQKTIRESAYAYRLKHVAERSIGRYVWEEEFIAAMDSLGFRRKGKTYAVKLIKNCANNEPGQLYGLGHSASDRRACEHSRKLS